MTPSVVLPAAIYGQGCPLRLEGHVGPGWTLLEQATRTGLVTLSGQQGESEAQNPNLLLECSCPLLRSLAAKTRCLQWYLGGMLHFVALLTPPPLLRFPSAC